MRAAVTRAKGEMAVLDVPDPGGPAPGEVLIRPRAVGICGSDFHYFLGELSEHAGGGFPRILGHEIAATVEAAGDGVEIASGQDVAIWPLRACGHCYPCRIGRPNVCVNFSLIGIHSDGAMQERLRVPASQVYPIAERRPQVAALTEPMSVAVRTIVRARIEAGERVVVLGAGPIGQSVAVAAMDRGATVLLVDPIESRLQTARGLGAEAIAWGDEVVGLAREWSDGEGAPVVIDATGVPDAIRAGVEMAASAGRFVQVGMSGHEVALRVGSFTEKELDFLGVSCCGGGEFGEAVALVERHGARLESLVSHEFPLERAPEALVYAMEHPTDVMKVVIRGPDG